MPTSSAKSDPSPNVPRLTRPQAAARLGVAIEVLDQLVRNREIACYKIGKRHKFSERDLDHFLASVRQEATR